MPELPEVEVVRRGLVDHAAGRTVHRVRVEDPRSLRRHAPGPADFADALAGLRLGTPQRRGKYLWIPLEDADAEPTDRALVVHLGMSGQLRVGQPEAPRPRHTRIVVELEPAPAAPARTKDDAAAATELLFVDQRIFGGLHLDVLLPTQVPGETVPSTVAHIARDPLDPHFDPAAVHARLRSRRTALKRALLDQGLVSGIGNIYADEALWRARLHWGRPTETITRPETRRVLEAAQEVMAAALKAGGTSFDALYVNVNGESGYFDRSLDAYGQAGRACRRCAAEDQTGVIVREPFMGRSSYRCTVCQRRPRRART